METLASKNSQAGAWVSVEDDFPPESLGDAHREFFAFDGKGITVATSDGSGFFDDQGDGFVAMYWMEVPDRWMEGLPPVGADVLVRDRDLRYITSYDGEGWAIAGARVEAEDFEFTGWQLLPELPGMTVSR
jgi:hypothetical protein